MNCKVVTTQYQLQVLENWEAYQQKILFFVKQAKERNANLLLLPEYAGLELAWLFKGSIHEQWAKLQLHLPNYLEFFSNTAKKFDLYIQSGTLPFKKNSGEYLNRAYFFNPHGNYDYQDKIIMTTSEDGLRLLSGGNTLKIFDTAFGRIGITICYDSEFPALVHLLAHTHNAKIILVPSYTDSMHGFYRVHLACRARALENQCYVVHACAQGKVESCEFLDETAVGSAGIFSPPDVGFPENGILALGDGAISNQLIEATLSLEKLEHVRAHGEVRNFQDHKSLEKISAILEIQELKF